MLLLVLVVNSKDSVTCLYSQLFACVEDCPRETPFDINQKHSKSAVILNNFIAVWNL